MNWTSKRGKSGLARMLMKEHGVSKRQAEKAVNAVFHCMARALRRGERVELPIGSIQAVSPPARKQKLQKFRNIEDGKIFFKLVRYPERIIRFRPKAALIEKAPFAAPLLRPEEARRLNDEVDELEQLVAALGFPKTDLQDWQMLMEAADGNRAWLLARLRQLRSEGRRFTHFHLLAGTVRDLYWIRN